MKRRSKPARRSQQRVSRDAAKRAGTYNRGPKKAGPFNPALPGLDAASLGLHARA